MRRAARRDPVGTPTPPGTGAQRGSALGAVVFALVLGAVLVGGFLWLEGRNRPVPAVAPGAAPAGAADRWTRLLGAFLARGPDGGTWETRYLSCVYTHYLAPAPNDPDVFYIAQVNAEGPAAPRAVSRWLVPRHFFRSPPALFFSNYIRSEGPIEDELDDGTPTIRVHWAPRANADGLVETERRVWFSREADEVVQIEDISRTGHLIRRVRRVSPTTGPWDLTAVDPDAVQRCERDVPDPGADPDVALASVAAEAPFPIYVPTYLPPGFVLVRTSYSVCDVSRSEGRPTSEGGKPVQLVSQLYADGLALISVAVAPRGDMDLIEMETAGMDEAGDDPSACPGLPADPRDIHQSGFVIRMRSDTCRTVLRRDDLEGISVTLIGRNELPADEYLRMAGSLQLAPRARSSGPAPAHGER